MDEREEDLPAQRAAGRDGARARNESEEAPRFPPRFAPERAAALEAPSWRVHRKCYRKRFGSDPRDQDPRGREPRARTPSTRDLDADVPERVRDPAWQLSDLACYLVNLADDLQQWLAHGSIDPEVLPQVQEELREIAKALDTGAPISPMTAIPVPPRATRRGLSRRGAQERIFDDDEIPF